jgi:Ca-activated chloride channel homolog
VKKLKRGCLVLACVLCGFTVTGQGLHASDTATVFHAGVDIVALNVVVTDGQQKPVNGLLANNFTVLEDGVPQDVSFFAASEVPLDLSILLDASASMSDKMQTVQEAAAGFAMRLNPSDRISVMAIKDTVKFVHPLDEDVEGALGAIRQTTAGGGTALYNALYMGMREMIKQRRGNGEVRRQAIAVLTDGDDTASLVSFDDVMDVAKQSGIAIYTITLKSSLPVKFTDLTVRRSFQESEFAMKALALETGARSFFPADISELAGVYGVIAQELSNQYSIGYSSKNPRQDGAFRHVLVRVDQPGARTRTRSGYVAARSDRRIALQ